MDQIENRLRDYFKNKKEIAAVYLFGSHAKGLARKDSDVDIALLFNPQFVPDIMELIELRENLSSFFQRDVDLVCLNTASPIIGMQIFKYGKCVWGEDNQILHRYWMHLFTDYCDLKWMRKPMEEDILKRKFYG